ncbi:MAG: FHA domain-containing protein [Microscillaceae bacterium]|nr:FHA domain-containing protein [Microscillaceae bacterium]
MKKILFWITLGMCMGAFSQIRAQSFRVQEEPDTSNFPKLRVIIQMNTVDQPQKSDFRVLDEDKNELDFEFEPISEEEESTGGRIVFFLIDASSYTNGPPLTGIKMGVSEALENLLNENDMVNVGYFGRADAGRSTITSLEPEFRPQSNITLLKDKLETRITAALSDSNSSVNAYSAMVEAIQEFDQISFEGQKMLIVLSGALDYPNAALTADDVIRAAERQDIAIYTLNHLRISQTNLQKTEIYDRISLRTNGDSYNVSSTNDIRNDLGEIFESGSRQEDKNIQQYELVFTSDAPSDGKTHKFSIEYKEEPPQEFSYNTPFEEGSTPPDGILQKYGIIILVIAGLLLGVIYYWYNERQIRIQEELEEEEELRAQMEEQEKKKVNESQSYIQELKEKNIRLQEQLKLKEQELAKKIDEVPTVIPPQKIDLKNTSIAGGGGAPFLQVSAGLFSQNFRLNKPTITIGRSANNDIVIPEQTVSSKHATITIEKGSFFINDLGSTNGTFVNGNRVTSKLLKSGDIIKLGAAHCRFEI